WIGLQRANNYTHCGLLDLDWNSLWTYTKVTKLAVY
ncbi:hypothetical protein CMV_027657, partial [Castanea mollissima]